jgi:hypothetical protein
VRLPEKIKILIKQAYPEYLAQLEVKTTIERHLDHLNSEGRYEGARDFLDQEEEALRQEAERHRLANRREAFHLVGRYAVPAIAILGTKLLSFLYQSL